MCLAVPGEIVKLEGSQAEVDFSGVIRRADVRLVPGVQLGDFVLVHAGCAIQVIPSHEARETIQLYNEVFGDNQDE